MGGGNMVTASVGDRVRTGPSMENRGCGGRGNLVSNTGRPQEKPGVRWDVLPHRRAV